MRRVLTTGGAIGALTLAFVLGARSEALFGSLAELRTRVEVQDGRIAQLRAETTRLETLVQVREFLDDHRIRLPKETVDRIAGSVHEAANRYEMEPAMILAVIRTESAFNVNALSHKGAVGLMQIMPATGQEIAQELEMEWRGEDLLRDPAANIVMGTYYLTKLLGRFEDMATALTAYNHGPGRVAALEEARATLPMGYAEKVLSYYIP